MGCGNSTATSDPNNNEKTARTSRTNKTGSKTGATEKDDKERGALEELKQEPEIDDVSRKRSVTSSFKNYKYFLDK